MSAKKNVNLQLIVIIKLHKFEWTSKFFLEKQAGGQPFSIAPVKQQDGHLRPILVPFSSL